MTTTQSPVESVKFLGHQVGPRAARHIETCFRSLLRGPGVELCEQFARVITHEAHPFGNFALVSDSRDVEAAVRAAAPLRELNAPSSLIFCDSALSNGVNVRLAHLGFVLAETMPAMAVDIASLAPTSLPAGYEFARVPAGPLSSLWVERLSIGYGFPRAVGDLFSPEAVGDTGAPDAAAQCWAVLKDGEPVCTSMCYLADGLAGIYCVATIPEERGKGLAAHATAEPLRRVANLGYRVGVLQSSSAGHSVYERLGFRDFSRVLLYVRIPE